MKFKALEFPEQDKGPISIALTMINKVLSLQTQPWWSYSRCYSDAEGNESS